MTVYTAVHTLTLLSNPVKQTTAFSRDIADLKEV